METAPARYAASRRAQIGWYQRASRWLTPVFQSSRPLWGWGRDLLFGPISRIPLFRNEMLAGQAGMKTGIFSIDRRDWTPGRPPPGAIEPSAWDQSAAALGRGERRRA